MPVIDLPLPAVHPGEDPDYSWWWSDSVPIGLRAALGGVPSAADRDGLWLLDHYAAALARAGIPEAVLEAATGLQRGTIARWRKLPVVPGMASCARSVADAISRGAAEAEAELAAAMHRRATTGGDGRAAQWLLERRAPARWSESSDDALAEARAQGEADARGRLIAAGWRPPAGSDGLVLPLKEGL